MIMSFWAEIIERHPEGERHLATHHGHPVRLDDADHAAWDAGRCVMVPCPVRLFRRGVRTVFEAESAIQQTGE